MDYVAKVAWGIAASAERLGGQRATGEVQEMLRAMLLEAAEVGAGEEQGSTVESVMNGLYGEKVAGQLVPALAGFLALGGNLLLDLDRDAAELEAERLAPTMRLVDRTPAGALMAGCLVVGPACALVLWPAVALAASISWPQAWGAATVFCVACAAAAAIRGPYRPAV